MRSKTRERRHTEDGIMKSNNDKSAPALESRSRVDASPTGRVLGGPQLSSLFKLPMVRPSQGKFVMPSEHRQFVSMEMDYASVERRILARFAEDHPLVAAWHKAQADRVKP